MFDKGFVTNNNKEPSKIHLFTSGYNNRCNINHCEKTACTAITDPEGGGIILA